MRDVSIPNKDLFNEARLKQLMRDEGFSAVIGISPANVTYLSGYTNLDMILLPRFLHAVIWPLEGEPTLVMYNHKNPYETFIRDIRLFSGYSERDTGIRTVVEALKDRGLNGEKVGIDLRSLPAYAWRIIEKELPEVRWEDGGDVIERARHIKTAKEVAMLRFIASASDKAIGLAYASARPTDTEKSVSDAMSFNVMRFGADIVAFNVMASGARTVHTHPLGEEKPLQPGTIVRCDFGAIYGGYYSDIARMAVVGGPTQRQRDTYARFWEIQQRVMEAARPGITGEELYDLAIKAHVEMGMGTRTMVGHSIGLATHERPMAAPGEDWIVQEGMVFNIENGSVIDEFDEKYHIEDTILITRNGYELLSDVTNTQEMTVIE